jgi:hypothetical protein
VAREIEEKVRNFNSFGRSLCSRRYSQTTLGLTRPLEGPRRESPGPVTEDFPLSNSRSPLRASARGRNGFSGGFFGVLSSILRTRFDADSVREAVRAPLDTTSFDGDQHLFLGKRSIAGARACGSGGEALWGDVANYSSRVCDDVRGAAARDAVLTPAERPPLAARKGRLARMHAPAGARACRSGGLRWRSGDFLGFIACRFSQRWTVSAAKQCGWSRSDNSVNTEASLPTPVSTYSLLRTIAAKYTTLKFA